MAFDRNKKILATIWGKENYHIICAQNKNILYKIFHPI